MFNILLIGLNHNSASVELREKLAFSDDDVKKTLKELANSKDIEELLIVSTCNRVEFLFTSKDSEKSIVTLKKYLADKKQIPIKDFEKNLYLHTNDDAAKHIFRVASSLDSMMIGEPQILGQIKNAFRLASTVKSSGAILNRLMHRTLNTAKKIRTETGIGDSAVSISYAAIELAKKIFGSLEGKKALLVGAGEMAELAVEHLLRNRVEDIYVANRTFKNGVKLAKKFNGTAIKFEEIESNLKSVDIIISSTGSDKYVIKNKMVKNIMKERKNRSLFFIDIAVPRDIDPTINKITNAYVYDIDDLNGIIDDNIEERNKEAVKGERIVEESVLKFSTWVEELKVVPTIIALREKMKEIADCEINKTYRNLNNPTDEDKEALERMTDSMINKILHHPITLLKGNNNHIKREAEYLNVLRNLFDLN
ncbi:MAG: glutamyl-tRNA reductase [Desulfobacterales bacterium]|nr:glutamyl-tRNA reductase [Desulfobacterales bacterium]MCP4162220.1 glutamyl-tRNA reductase [Deltaproteobacteria bacterium]